MAPRKTKASGALKPLNPNSTAMTPRRAEVKKLKDENEALRGEMADLAMRLENVKVAEAPPAKKPMKPIPTIPEPNFALIRTPDAPTRPTSAYIYFCNAERPNLKGMSTSEQAKVLGAKWKEIPESEKVLFLQSADADKARYESEMKKYNSQMEKVNLEKASLVKLYEARKREMAVHYYEQQISGEGPKELPFTIPSVPARPVRVAPKKPKNAYNLYCADRRQALEKKGEKLDFGESMKQFSAEWSKLDSTKTGKKKLAKYTDMAASEKERYSTEMEAFNALVAQDENEIRAHMTKLLEAEKKEALKRFGPEVKAEAAAKAQQQLAKEQKKARKAQRELEPKRPRSAYILFSMATRDSVAASMPDASSAMIMSELGRLWKEASEQVKAKYAKEASADKARYDSEMEEFKSKNMA